MQVSREFDIASIQSLDAYEAVLLSLTMAGDRVAYLYAEDPMPIVLGEVHDREFVAAAPATVDSGSILSGPLDDHETVKKAVMGWNSGPRLLDLLYVNVPSQTASSINVPSCAQRRDTSKELPEILLDKYHHNLADVLRAWSPAVSDDGYLALLIKSGAWAGESYLPITEAHYAATESVWQLSFAMPDGDGSRPSSLASVNSTLLVYRREAV